MMFTELQAIIRIAKREQNAEVETLATRLAKITKHSVTIQTGSHAYAHGQVVGSTETGALVIKISDGSIRVGPQVMSTPAPDTDEFTRLTPDAIEHAAHALAEVVNGGSWETDYTDAQKDLWKRRVVRAMEIE